MHSNDHKMELLKLLQMVFSQPDVPMPPSMDEQAMDPMAGPSMPPMMEAMPSDMPIMEDPSLSESAMLRDKLAGDVAKKKASKKDSKDSKKEDKKDSSKDEKKSDKKDEKK